MSPFWNHILANLADLSMCLIKSPAASAVRTYFSSSLALRLRVASLWSFCVPSVPTLILRFFEMTACALATSACALATSADRLSSPHLCHWTHRGVEFVSPIVNPSCVAERVHVSNLSTPPTSSPPLNWYVHHGYWCPPLKGAPPCWRKYPC